MSSDKSTAFVFADSLAGAKVCSRVLAAAWGKEKTIEEQKQREINR